MRTLLHAPNVHVGGGLSLLRALLACEPFPFDWIQLDHRAQSKVVLPEGTFQTCIVRPTPLSRLLAEWRLFRVCREGDVVLCFHGLPPLLPVRGRVVVFAQNRLLLETVSLKGCSRLTRLRIAMERAWLRAFRFRCDRIIVQTSSMASLAEKSLSAGSTVSIAPFMPPMNVEVQSAQPGSRHFDFVYVATGEAHKNHLELLEAWRLLAERGMRPSLGLTISGRRYPGLASLIDAYSTTHDLNIVNVGEVVDPHGLYRSSSAAIYPSSTESLGLPLLEATAHGLPILAAERDYVRDVIEPNETFDPNSPLSIARAVARFSGRREAVTSMGTPKDFLREVLR